MPEADPPTIAGRYRLLEEVGHGGMAIVYRGLDTTLGREVAVKVLHPHLADEEESRARFTREAVAVARLRHPNILEIFDYSGPEAPSRFIVTEFIDGETLKELIARRPIPLPEYAALIVLQVCEALSHAHGEGVIHRDVKPENIMIRRDGQLKLMDFGIAQVVDIQRLTVSGQLLGSPAYMAPEQVDGRPLDFRTDVFSCGTLLYQLATGKLPFQGRNPHEVLKRIASGVYPDPELVNPQVPAALGRILRRALARRPEDRYQHVEELRAALATFLDEADISAPRDELRRFFADPDSAAADLRARVVACLVRKGKELVAEGRKARAMAVLNRVLCLEPRHPEVGALLDRMARRRRVGRTAGALVALAVLAGVGFGAYRSLSWITAAGRGAKTAERPTREIPKSPPRVAGAALTDRGPAAGPARALPASRPPAAAAATSAREPHGPSDTAATRALPVLHDPDATLAGRRATAADRPEPVRAPAGKSGVRVVREVRLIPFPKTVSISVNGRPLGEFPAVQSVPLLAGENTIVLSHPACEDKTIVVDGSDPPPEIRERLLWKPATAIVECGAAPGAEVTVGGMTSRCGEPIRVPLPEDQLTPDYEVGLVVRAPGRAEFHGTAALRAGSRRTIHVDLAREGG